MERMCVHLLYSDNEGYSRSRSKRYDEDILSHHIMTLQYAHLRIIMAAMFLSSFYRTAGLPLRNGRHKSVIGISLKIILLPGGYDEYTKV